MEWLYFESNTAQKKNFSIKGFFSKCDQIRSFLRILAHLPKKTLMKNFIFCAVQYYLCWRNPFQSQLKRQQSNTKRYHSNISLANFEQ